MDTTTEATIWILVIISLLGTCLNSLVLCVFFKLKNKHTSTPYVFILAFVDLFTCAFTIPLCVVMEFKEHETSSDFLCKSYHLLTTTTVPLSAVLMVVIAIDRYVRICTFNASFLTTRAIFVTVSGIVIFALSLGCLCAMGYGVQTIHARFPTNDENFTDSNLPEDMCDLNFDALHLDLNSVFINTTVDQILLEHFNSYKRTNVTCASIDELFGNLGISVCRQSNIYFSDEFNSTYSVIYSLVYACSCIIAVVLYGKIYYFIASRRKRNVRRYRPNVLMKSQFSNTEQENSVEKQKEKLHRKFSCSLSLLRSNFLSRKETMRRKNIKTASMLASVAFVFTASFLPAWLMKFRFVPFNDVIFHLYFIYCVINPFIYAFCISKFKTTLKEMIFKRRRTPFVL